MHHKLSDVVIINLWRVSRFGLGFLVSGLWFRFLVVPYLLLRTQKNNLRATWNVISKILNNKRAESILVTSLTHDGKIEMYLKDRFFISKEIV